MRGAASLSRFDYGYDDVGNRTSKVTPAVSESYTYDEVYQLDTVRRNTTLTEDYGHDPVGNRNSTLALPNPSQWVHSNRNELLTSGSATFTYDLNGNLATKSDTTGAWTYEWDAENRLTRVTRNGAEVARYRYDPLGRRVEKLAGAVRTTYVYDGEDILRERVGNSNRYFVHGPGIDEPLARVVGSTPTYLHADGLGSIVSHTNAAGKVVYSRSYDAFGNLESGAGEAGYAFTGREWDPETGLYYYRARYYDPKVGRLLSEDPVPATKRQLWDLNGYAYARSNPVTYVDHNGEAAVVAGGAVIGAGALWAWHCMNTALANAPGLFPAPAHGGAANFDKQKHCYVACYVTRCMAFGPGMMTAMSGQVLWEASSGGVTWSGRWASQDAQDDTRAAAWGTAGAFMFASCESKCRGCPYQ